MRDQPYIHYMYNAETLRQLEDFSVFEEPIDDEYSEEHRFALMVEADATDIVVVGFFGSPEAALADRDHLAPHDDAIGIIDLTRDPETAVELVATGVRYAVSDF